MNKGRLPGPLLYLSSYFDQRKSVYYDRLQYARERGEINEWTLFFLDGVAVQATDAVDRAELLSGMREDYRTRLRGNRSRASEVVDLLFANPVLTVRHVQNQLRMSQPGAANILRLLTGLGILKEYGQAPAHDTAGSARGSSKCSTRSGSLLSHCSKGVSRGSPTICAAGVDLVGG